MIVQPTSIFKDRHKGRRGIIMGSGWSLSEYDLTEFKNDITLAVNQAVSSLDHCSYFCMSDGATPEANFFEYGCSIADNILFFGSSLQLSPGINKIWDKIKDKSFFIPRRSNTMDFNFNLEDDNLIWGFDVCQVTTHMAYIMGCSPLILIGVDLNYKNHKKYCNNTKIKEEVTWSEKQGYGNSFFYSGHSEGIDDPYLSHSCEGWRAIKSQNPNLNILTANPKSNLIHFFNCYEKS